MNIEIMLLMGGVTFLAGLYYVLCYLADNNKFRILSRLLLFICCPCFLPFYISYLLLKKVTWMPRKKSRSPKSLEKPPRRRNILFKAFNCLLSCFFHMSPISISFTKSLSVKEVVSRYNEQKLITANELHEKLKENEYLNLILNILNGQNSRFFFKILLSGSLREGYGKPLPFYINTGK